MYVQGEYQQRTKAKKYHVQNINRVGQPDSNSEVFCWDDLDTMGKCKNFNTQKSTPLIPGRPVSNNEMPATDI